MILRPSGSASEVMQPLFESVRHSSPENAKSPSAVTEYVTELSVTVPGMVSVKSVAGRVTNPSAVAVLVSMFKLYLMSPISTAEAPEAKPKKVKNNAGIKRLAGATDLTWRCCIVALMLIPNLIGLEKQEINYHEIRVTKLDDNC